MGGIFNPPHNGHTAIAGSVVSELGLDRIVFVPTAVPPHKGIEELAAIHHRIEMLKLALEELPHSEISLVETLSPHSPSYTVDTLLEFTQPDVDLFLIIGADNLLELNTWKDPIKIAELSWIVVVPRGIRKSSIKPDLPDAISNRVIELDIEPIHISSTHVRNRVCRGFDIEKLVAPRVSEYITKKGLFKT